jgi:lysozyme
MPVRGGTGRKLHKDRAAGGGALPPAVDAERMGPCPSGETVADIRGEMLAFMNTVEAHYGKRPLVYVTYEFHQAYLDGSAATERFWVRSLFLPPSIREQSWLFWQFHHRGLRPGIRGPVDLDAFRGSMDDLAAIAR